MDYYDEGATYEDMNGEVFEYEAHLDALDKLECENKCWFSAMEYHKSSCPLYTEADRRLANKTEDLISMALGK